MAIDVKVRGRGDHRGAGRPSTPGSPRSREIGFVQRFSALESQWAIPMLPAVLLSALSGWVLSFAFPSPNVWGLAFVGVGGLLAALHGRGFWSGALVGLVGGIAFWFSLIHWVTLFLGLVPLLALGMLEAVIMAAGAGLIAMTYRAVPRVWPGRAGRLVVAPLVVAAAWTARETVGG